MSVKRRDNKNRILRNRESQRSDGRYAYVYVDNNGKQKFLYSWKLENTDKVLQGKRDCISLREKIKMFKKDLDDGIVSNGRGYSTIHTVRGVVRPTFQMAVDDDLIRKNPFEFMFTTVVVNDSITREAITRKQGRTFLEFVRNDKHFCKYYDGSYILFHTVLRISEFVGLTVNDIDMRNRKINVNHQLQ